MTAAALTTRTARGDSPRRAVRSVTGCRRRPRSVAPRRGRPAPRRSPSSRAAGVDRRHLAHGVPHRAQLLHAGPERGVGLDAGGLLRGGGAVEVGGGELVEVVAGRSWRGGGSSAVVGRPAAPGWFPGAEPAGELGPPAGDAGPHRARRDAEGVGDLRVVEIAEVPEHDRGAELLGQLGERVVDGQAVREDVDRRRPRWRRPRRGRGRRAARAPPAACDAAARRGTRSSPPGTPRWRTRPARRSARCRGRWRSGPPGWRRAASASLPASRRHTAWIRSWWRRSSASSAARSPSCGGAHQRRVVERGRDAGDAMSETLCRGTARTAAASWMVTSSPPLPSPWSVIQISTAPPSAPPRSTSTVPASMPSSVATGSPHASKDPGIAGGHVEAGRPVVGGAGERQPLELGRAPAADEHEADAGLERR